MRFVLKVLVLVMLIVVSKFVKEEDNSIAANQNSTPASRYQDFSVEVDQTPAFTKPTEAKVEKASLQFN